MLEAYRAVRQRSKDICEPLATEDYGVQSMPDASPTRWHLAHTTWFFETFCLGAVAGYQPFDPAFETLFNSYYQSVGKLFPRDRRGMLTRPTVDEIWRYREQVDRAMESLLARPDRPHGVSDEVVRTGLNHEQQHQELMLTDIKHAFSCNPILPVYRDGLVEATSTDGLLRWVESNRERIENVGFDDSADGQFCFDNELPRHRALLGPFAIASRLVTCGEYRDFIDDGGYERPEHWLSAGWAMVQSNRWRAPMHWHSDGLGCWTEFTLGGVRPLSLQSPVRHVSYYEADAFARWSGHRLPTEFEWEVIVRNDPDELDDAYGNAWQWTASDYAGYPGYVPPAGAIGEYNGKFMCGQKVLRGSSWATPPGHSRAAYRNFFDPSTRWQFTGIRLAKTLC